MNLIHRDVSSRKATENLAFLSARDYIYDDSKHLERNFKRDGRLQNPQSGKSRVAVILGYFNGQDYISEQLESILNQTHSTVHIYVCDDNSEPRFAVDSLRFNNDQLSQISVGIRPRNIGFTNNFLYALANVYDDFEYYAFSDQDDIWREDKLEKAITALKKFSSNKPALYCARTEITDTKCEQTLGYSPILYKPPSFANALVQNISSGNTMVFNKAAKDLILKTIQNTTVVSYDWWCYQIITGAGGNIIYDNYTCLKYRQHSKNLVGARAANTGWRAFFLRISKLLKGRFRKWNDINLTALSAHIHLLTATNQKMLDDFIQARQQSSLLKRLMLFKRSGIYRQTLLGNLGLFLGILLNRV